MDRRHGPHPPGVPINLGGWIICVQCSLHGKLMQINILKNKQSNPKMGLRPKQTFLQRRHTDGQQTCEKMLNVAHY